MPDRYWVGGAGTWSNTSTTNWAATSGGASGATAPTQSDSVFFDANSGATPFTVTMGTGANCLDMTTSVANITYGSTGGLNVRGNFNINASTTWSATGTVEWFPSNATIQQISANGVIFNGGLSFFAGPTWAQNLASNIGTVSTANIRINANNGTFNGNGFTFVSANNIVTDVNSNTNSVINNLRFAGNYVHSAAATTGTTLSFGGTWVVGNFNLWSGFNTSFSTNTVITCNNRFSFGFNTTSKTVNFGANIRIYIGNTAANNSLLLEANGGGWTNTTLSFGSNNKFVVGYNSTNTTDVALIAGPPSSTFANMALNLDVPQGNFICNIGGILKDLNFVGFGGNFLNRGTELYGNCTFVPTMSLSGTGNLIMGANGGGTTLDLQANGLTVPFPIQIRSAGTNNTVVRLANTLTMTANNANGNLFIGAGGFLEMNGFNVNCSRIGWTTSTSSYVGLVNNGAPANINVLNNLGGVVVDFSGGNIPFTSGSNRANLNIELYGSNAATIQMGNAAQRFPVFVRSGSGTLTLEKSIATSQIFGDTDFTGFSGALTQSNGNIIWYGNLKLSTTMTVPNAGANNTWTFSGVANAAQFFDSAGLTINRNISIGSSSGNINLQNNVTQGSNTDLSLDGGGRLTMNNFNWSTFSYFSNNATLDWGSNNSTISITGQPATSGTTQTFLSYNANTTFTGTVRFSLTSNGSIGGTTWITTNATLSNTGNRLLNVAVNDSTANINLPVAANTGYRIQLNGNVRNLNLANMNHTQQWANDVFVCGNLTVPATGGTMVSTANVLRVVANSGLQGVTNTVTVDTGNRALDFPLWLGAGDGSGATSNGSVRLLSNLTSTTGSNAGSRVGVYSYANPLDLNNFTITTGNFNMNNPGTNAGIAFGSSGRIVLTTQNTNNVFNIANSTSFYTTGNAQVNLISTGGFTSTFNMGNELANKAQLPNLTVTSTSGAFVLSGHVADLTFNCPGTTITTSSVAPNIWGNYTYTAGTLQTGGATWAFNGDANTGNRFINTNNVAHNFNIWNVGSGNRYLANNLIVGANTISSVNWWQLVGGNLALNNFAIFVRNVSSTGSTVRSIDFGTSGNITLLGTGATVSPVWDSNPATNLTFSGNIFINSSTNSTAGSTRSYSFGNITENSTFSVRATAGARSILIGTTYADNVSFSGNILDLDLTGGWTGNINWGVSTVNVHGNFLLPATGGNIFANGNSISFTSTNATARTINTNARATDWPYVFNGVGGTFSLGANLVVGTSNTVSSRTVTLTAGNFNLNNFAVTANQFNSSSSSNRTLSFGSSGIMTLFGNVNVIDISTATEFNLSGTPIIISNPTTAVVGGNRIFALGATAAFTTGGTANGNNTLGFNVGNTGNGIRFIEAGDTGANTTAASPIYVRDFNLTGGTKQYAFSNLFVNGNMTIPATGPTWFAGSIWSMSGQGNYTVNTNARGLNVEFRVNGTGNYSVISNLNTGQSNTVSIYDFVLLGGNCSIANNIEITASRINANSSTSRNFDFAGTGSRIRILSNNVTAWNSNNGANFSYSGTPYIESIYTGATGIRVFDFGNIPEAFTFDIVVPTGTPGVALNTATDTVSIIGNVNNMTMTTFAGTLNNNFRTIRGNLSIPAAGGTYTSGSVITEFGATSGTRTIDTAGRQLQFPLRFNGQGGTFVLNSNIVANSTTSLILQAGNVDFQQRGSITTTNWANILIGNSGAGNCSLSNLTTNLPFVHSSANLTILSGAVNSSTTGTYTFSGGNLNIGNAFSTGAFTQSGGNLNL